MSKALRRLPPPEAHALLHRWQRAFDWWHMGFLHQFNRPLAHILTAEWEEWFSKESQILEERL